MDTYTTAEGVYSYTYDANGNILTISKDGVLLEAYTYDSLNQLKTVTKGADIYEYTYDNGGNILNVKLNGAVTDTYTYGDENWKDKLTVYNGQTLTYDSIGNPLTYRDGMAMTWQNGRQLYTLDNSAVGITNSYNIDGLRTEKTVLNKTANTTVTYSYEYNGNLLVRQAWNENIMWFLYDESGNSVGFTLNGTEYYYIKNVQGDITAIADSTGTILAKYSYDVWGRVLTVTDGNGNDVSANENHIANVNPLRYRGYYYDSETGFYYLLSRYYDPVTRRFISADGQLNTDSLLGFNMFAYCENNPVMYVDPTGEWPSFWIRPYVLGLADMIIRLTCMALGSQEESIYYDVPLYDQGNTNLCWAYSQAMIEDHRSGIWRNYSDAKKRVREIVVETIGFYADVCLSPNAIRDLTRIKSPRDIYDALTTYGPLYVEYDLWGQNGDRLSGHAIVVTGINIERGLVFTNNPWGKRGIQTFEEFQRGFVGCKDDGWLLMAYYYLEQGA